MKTSGLTPRIKDLAETLFFFGSVLLILALVGWGIYGLLRSGHFLGAVFSLLLLGVAFWGGIFYASREGTFEDESSRRTVVAILWFTVGFLFATARPPPDESYWPAALIAPILLVFSWGMTVGAQQRREDYLDKIEGRTEEDKRAGLVRRLSRSPIRFCRKCGGYNREMDSDNVCYECRAKTKSI